MVMGAWGLFAAPLMATAPFQDDPEAAAEAADAFAGTEQALPAADDVFGGLSVLDDGAMTAASGGTSTAFDIGHIGVAIGENDGSVNDVDVNHSQNGGISNNLISDNHGITTVYFNTGNGVIFQNNVNVNVFLGAKTLTGQ